MVEFVQYPGDTVFLPGNWWHCVINIDDTAMVTQNYAGRHNFPLIWRAARVERPCWSRLWFAEMEKQMPSLAQRARLINSEDNFDHNEIIRKNKERHNLRRSRRYNRAL